jgi:hypothetical protein
MKYLGAKVLGFFCLALLVGVVAAGPAAANPAAAVITPAAEVQNDPLIVQPLVQSDCSPGLICLWSGPTFGGQQSFWHGYETGCHALENINPQSVFNDTENYTAEFPYGPFELLHHDAGPGSTIQFEEPWPSGFCIH